MESDTYVSFAVCGTEISDDELLAQVTRLAGAERHATAQLIASLAELDARRLYLGQGCSSLFTYCTRVLHLSEHAAYGRIEAARAARRFPLILDRLARGSITLTTVTLLAPHLTPDNHRAVLDAATHMRKRDVEELVARLHPQPSEASFVRKLPARPPVPPRTPASVPAPAPAIALPTVLVAGDPCGGAMPVASGVSRQALVTPLAPDRYKVQVTVSRETAEKLRHTQDLMRHTVPDGDLSIIIDRALTLLLSQLERQKLAAVTTPRPGRVTATRSRHIPAAVRRAVWTRDQGQCAFVGAAGRCTERGRLEFHHVVPYARGGAATVGTIALRCRAHNQHEAELDFGPGAVRRREPHPLAAGAADARGTGPTESQPRTPRPPRFHSPNTCISVSVPTPSRISR